MKTLDVEEVIDHVLEMVVDGEHIPDTLQSIMVELKEAEPELFQREIMNRVCDTWDLYKDNFEGEGLALALTVMAAMCIEVMTVSGVFSKNQNGVILPTVLELDNIACALKHDDREA